MKAEFDADIPIYVQIAESIEDDILRGLISEESQVMSTNQLASHYRINPATAAKGLNMLVNDNILYKKRGLGMFVASGAAEKIQAKRTSSFYEKFVLPLVREAKGLGISRDTIRQMVDKAEGNGDE